MTTIRLTHRSTNDAEQFPQQEVSTADDDFATKAQSVIVALLDAYERGDQSDVLNFSCDGLHDEFAQQSPREFAEQAKNDVDRRGLALFWGTETTDLTDRGVTLVAYIRYLGDDKDPDKKGRPVLFGLKNTDRWRVCAIRPLNQ
ncbi:hypothetical protein F5X71_01715 [Nocardia brasiliensis]|uniref:Uncharacterized protein n=1 Tax=Nocardia brasiliensis TaxID=37326 RepID=A0A6G9XK15_NOCBR|nr:hypothetical protein [Nocardia brasiliensis]QIS01200.1 hypothetical protein F5X71_01715 [Nocardia brasiliensis]